MLTSVNYVLEVNVDGGYLLVGVTVVLRVNGVYYYLCVVRH